MKHILLTQGEFAIVDDADYDWLNRIKWHVERNKYLCYASASRTNSRSFSIMMHRLILGLQRKDGKQADHIDGNGLNNQRANLRVCNPTQNQHNQRRRGAATSKYKGVYWQRKAKKWRADIKINRKGIYLGTFDNEIEAARAYNRVALEKFGEFALLNEFKEGQNNSPAGEGIPTGQDRNLYR